MRDGRRPRPSSRISPNVNVGRGLLRQRHPRRRIARSSPKRSRRARCASTPRDLMPAEVGQRHASGPAWCEYMRQRGRTSLRDVLDEHRGELAGLTPASSHDDDDGAAAGGRSVADDRPSGSPWLLTAARGRRGPRAGVAGPTSIGLGAAGRRRCWPSRTDRRHAQAAPDGRAVAVVVARSRGVWASSLYWAMNRVVDLLSQSGSVKAFGRGSSSVRRWWISERLPALPGDQHDHDQPAGRARVGVRRARQLQLRLQR